MTSRRRILMKGNEALAEAAIRAGCGFYFGYPITPQNEVPAYMAKHLPEQGGVFVQAESEVAAINMVFGAAACGARVMTSSSSPGISLKQEGISYIAGAELPCVIVNMVRGGPGLGNIAPSQCDYFQSTRGGGHGDYRTMVLAPASVQELADLTYEAFDLADEFRNPVLILADGFLGQMMEPLVLPEKKDLTTVAPKPWALTGAKGRRANLVKTLHLNEDELEQVNLKLAEKYRDMEREIRYEEIGEKRGEILMVAFGTAARVAREAMIMAGKIGIKASLFRPITLFPFPSEALRKASEGFDKVLVLELNLGQMVEDVRLALEGSVPVEFYGRTGGKVFDPEEVLEVIQKVKEKGL
jgi:2-oxoglutarate ferredoxin oxidoreductase subunit alpha